MKLTALVLLSLALVATSSVLYTPPHKTTAPPTTTTAAPTTTTAAPTTTTTTLSPGQILDKNRREKLAKRLAAVGGCNANVCFAIDGSGSITPSEFTMEKNFVLDVGSVISVDDAVEVAAVQYATANWPIQKLTVDIEKFNLRVNAAKQSGGASFVAAGINYCFSQLWRRRGEANKIVVLGDGRSNIGADAVKRADLFRRVGGDVSVVAAGFPDDNKLLELAGGDPSKVFDVTSFLDTLALQLIIEELVEDVCGIDSH